MEKIIKGNKYMFFINVLKIGKEVNFSIESLHKNSHTRSCINNVNCILSALNVETRDRRFWESEWILTRKEADYFFTKANKFLMNSGFIARIENQLDLDRELGEWNMEN